MNTARLIVLGIALAAGGGALMLMTRSGPTAPQAIVQALPVQPKLETDEVLTAAHDIPLGTIMTDAEFAWLTWPRAAVGAGMIKKGGDADQVLTDLKGSVTRSSFISGEPIRREKLVKGPNSGFMSAILPSGQRAVAINIDTQGGTTAGGFILPNDRVDVIRTFRDEDAARPGGGDAFSTETLLSNIRVLAIGQNVQEKNGERVVVGSNATLEVDSRQAETLVLAQRVGQLSLVLRSMLDSAKSNTPDDSDAAGAQKTMTIVRFGVASAMGKR